MQGVSAEHRFADVNGVRLHHAIAGKGKPLIFLHGFPEFWYAWKNQLAELGGDYQVVAPDMRGYNLSSKPAEVEQCHAVAWLEKSPPLFLFSLARAGHLARISGRQVLRLTLNPWRLLLSKNCWHPERF